MLPIIAGECTIPEGFPVMIARTVNTAGPLGTFSAQLDPEYWFFLERIVSKWTIPTDAASIPKLSLYRDGGQRSYWEAMDLRMISTPAIAFSSASQDRPKGTRLNHTVQLGIYFPPGALLQMRITGHVANDPATVKIAAVGRYVLAPEGLE
jgi:hypothetical protein